VFKNIHTYNSGKAALYTWVRTIIINTCLNFIRANEKIIATQEIGSSSEAYIHPDVVSSLKSDDILQLVKKLPPATQAVFNLFAIDGYAHKEIAEMLHISEGTSKWHINEARKTLQKQLKGYM
jgi:RNA polymerase sigma-70 factor (ECF subfamily)